MKRSQAGFTILELMLVVTIGGILLAIAIPSMGNFIRNSRITSAANDVMAALHFARSESIKRRMPVTLCTSANTLNADNTQNDAATCADSPFLTGWIAFVDTNQSGQREVGEAILLIPAHVDPTVNLHGTLHAVEEDGSLRRWAIDARRP